MEKFKRAKEWTIGQKYYVEMCGVWRGLVVYTGTVLEGNRIKHEFTFGTFENRDSQFSIVSAKSNLKVYDFEVNSNANV